MACIVNDCVKPAKTRGMCGMHAERVRAHGTTDPQPRKTFAQRFWEKVDKSGNCWLWTASVTRKRGGYGQISIGHAETLPAHRVAYELIKGPIPAGLVLDHLCRTPRCVNPDHLEPVTIRENTIRGVEARKAAI